MRSSNRILVPCAAVTCAASVAFGQCDLEEVGSLKGRSQEVRIVDEIAFIANNAGGLHIVSLADPARPRLISKVPTGGWAGDLAVEDGVAYVAARRGGLLVIDVADPTRPEVLAHVETGEWASHVEVEGDYLLLGLQSHVQLFDVSDPGDPKPLGTYGTPEQASVADIEIRDGVAFLALWSLGVQIIDLSDPLALSLVATLPAHGRARDVALDGNLVFYTGSRGTGFVIYDISDIANPRLVAESTRFHSGFAISVRDEVVYLVHQYNGFSTFDVSDPSEPRLVGWEVVDGGWSSPVFWNEKLALPGAAYPMWTIDVRDPRTPFGMDPLGVYQTPQRSVDVEVVDGLAYVADSEGGLQVVDVSDPAFPVPVGWHATAGNLNKVEVVGDLVYATDYDRSLQVYDVSDPAQPVKLSEDLAPYRRGDQHLAVIGDHVLLAGSRGLRSVDVADPTTLVVADELPLHRANGLAVHRGVAYVPDELDDLHVIDVSDPTDLRSITAIDLPATGTAVATEGGLLYVGDVRGRMQIFDITEADQPLFLGAFALPHHDGRRYGRDRISDITVVNGLAYLAGSSRGLLVVDVSNPRAPRLLRHHAATGAAGFDAVGDLLYIVRGQEGLGIYDATSCSACAADLNGDGAADADDFFLFLDLFAARDRRADFDGSGDLAVDDFFVFLDFFAAGC